MKQILIILGLLASVSTFAQSPRIKLNQITKDTVKGSVLISSPTDSGMVYSRDFYVAYGADTVLILYGDTLAATSGIISSVLSDGVTITGDGTSGNELKVDTSLIATIKALNDSLATISASTTPDGVTITGDGSVGNPLKVDTATVISTIKGLVDTLSARGYLTANQTITLSGDVTGSGTTAITATVVDDSHNHIISNIDFLQDSLNAKANASELSNYLLTSNYIVDSTRINATGDTAFYYQNGVEIGSQSIAGGGGTTYNNISETADTVFVSKFLDVDTATLYVDAVNNRVGIGTSTPSTTFEMKSQTGGAIFEIEYTPDLSPALQFNDSDDTTSYFMVRSGSSTDSRFLPVFEAQRGRGQEGTGGPGYLSFWSARIDSTLDTYADLGGGFVVECIRIGEELTYDVQSMVLFNVRNRNTSKFRVEADGGIFAQSLGAAAGTYPVEYNTSTKELTYDNTSSIRFKDNIRPFTKGLNELLNLEPVSYEYKATGFTAHGFIAEQVLESNLDEIVTYNENGLIQGLRRKFFFPLIVKAIQEQQAIIETQATEIEQLKTLITDLTNRLTILENK